MRETSPRDAWHVVLPGLLGDAERDLLLGVAEAVGWTPIDEGPAPLVGPAGYRSLGGRRQHRAALSDEGLARALWARLRVSLPALPGGQEARAMNPRLRFYAYDPGHAFPPHTDGAWRAAPEIHSALTLLVYLTEAFEGGETVFLDDPAPLRQPAGTALVFPHGRWHEGRVVTSGRKVVIRGDLFYEAAPGAIS